MEGVSITSPLHAATEKQVSQRMRNELATSQANSGEKMMPGSTGRQ